MNANVNYITRRQGNRWIVINTDRNRRMAKEFTTEAAANAHIAQTRRRVRRIIQYHNRANAAGAGRAGNPPPRNPVPNVGRAANPQRRGRPRGARNRNQAAVRRNQQNREAAGRRRAAAYNRGRGRGRNNNRNGAGNQGRGRAANRQPRQRRGRTPVPRRGRPRRARNEPERFIPG